MCSAPGKWNKGEADRRHRHFGPRSLFRSDALPLLLSPSPSRYCERSDKERNGNAQRAMRHFKKIGRRRCTYMQIRSKERKSAEIRTEIPSSRGGTSVTLVPETKNPRRQVGGARRKYTEKRRGEDEPGGRICMPQEK